MEEKSKVLNLNISNISFQNAVKSVIVKAVNKQSGFFCFSNAHMTIESLKNKQLEAGLNKQGAVVLSDGFSIAKSIKMLYGFEQERIAGMDFLPVFLRESNKHSHTVLLFGSSEEILKMAEQKIQNEYPNIHLEHISPPFQQGLPDDRYVHIINNASPHVVVVALGCPKQEIWMSQNYEMINAPLLGLGGALPVYAGVLKRAPRFIRNIGFEWLFRLFQEPGRLWKRYLITNSLFIYYFSKQWIRVKILGKT